VFPLFVYQREGETMEQSTRRYCGKCDGMYRMSYTSFKVHEKGCNGVKEKKKKIVVPVKKVVVCYGV
jgi:hypothetical protein